MAKKSFEDVKGLILGDKSMDLAEFVEWTMNPVPSKKHRESCLYGNQCKGAGCTLCVLTVKCENSFIRLAHSALEAEATIREIESDRLVKGNDEYFDE